MTLNSKVLSLVLLSGLTMGGTFAKKQKLNSTDWTNESQTVKWSEDACNTCTECQPTTCKECPNTDPVVTSCCTTQLNFATIATPANVVLSNGILGISGSALAQPSVLSAADISVDFGPGLDKVVINGTLYAQIGKNFKDFTGGIVIGSPEVGSDIFSKVLLDLDWTKFTTTYSNNDTVAKFELSMSALDYLKSTGATTAVPSSVSNTLWSLYPLLLDADLQVGAYSSTVATVANPTVTKTLQVQGTPRPCCCRNN